jgi:hypothetical protein
MSSGSRSSAALWQIGLWHRQSIATVSLSSPFAAAAAVSMNPLRASVGWTDASGET